MSRESSQKDVRIECSHPYTEVWEKEELYCPKCGKKSVWAECSEGDYYVGNQYICLDCESSFFLPNGIMYPGPNDQQRIDQLKEE